MHIWIYRALASSADLQHMGQTCKLQICETVDRSDSSNGSPKPYGMRDLIGWNSKTIIISSNYCNYHN